MSDVMWTTDLTDTLIDLYRTESVLWDTTDENFKNKYKKRNAWKSISVAMGIHQLEIQRKIKNLSAQFFRENRKFKMNIQAGAAPSEIPKWLFYNRLLFLVDRNESKLLLEKGLSEIYDSETEVENSANRTPIRKFEVYIDDEDTIPDPPPGGSTSDTGSNMINCLKRKISSDQGEENLRSKKSRSRFFSFGEYIAAKIEALQSSYAQNMVEHLISNILFDASLGKYDVSFPEPQPNE